MSEAINPSESPIPATRPNQEILIDDIVGNKSLKMKLSWDFIEKLLEEGKLEKQSSGCFQAAEGVLKEMEKQGILDDLEHLDTVDSIGTSDVVPLSQDTPVPVFQRRRGRPRKETNVLSHSLESELSSIPSNSKVLNFCSRQSSKRKSNALKVDESTDGEYPSGFEQTNFRGKSKRRRQPKVLDDYVTDFDTSDEEMENYSHRSPTYRFSKQRGRGRSKRPHALHSFENDDILSYYLGDFDKKFSEQDLFPDKIFEDTHDSKEDDEDAPNITDTKSAVGAAVSDRKDPLTAGLGIDNTRNNVALDLDDHHTRSTHKNRGSNRTHHQQLAALQQRYCQLLQKLQKKPPVNKVVDLVHGASNLLSEEQLVFFALQLKSSSTNLQGVRFSAREKVLALAIYAHSPETYKWLQSIFYLPTKLILDRWLEAIAKNNPETVKKLIYYIYNKYIFNS